jgi:hypothetical protein
MGGSFSVDTKDFRRLAKELEAVAKKAIPHAVRDSLNTAAFEGRKQWAGEMQKSFTLRNKWTERSIRVEKATGVNLSNMQSVVGSLAPYMATQELGGVEQSKGRHGVPIPTSTAAGQSMKARRTKQVQKRNWQSAISLPAKVGGSRQRRNMVAVIMAAKTGGVAFLDLSQGDPPKKRRKNKQGVVPPPRRVRGRKKGLFRVTGSNGKLKVRMIWDMTRKTVVVKRRPTLEPTVQWVEGHASEWQRDAIIKQLKRRKVLGY